MQTEEEFYKNASSAKLSENTLPESLQNNYNSKKYAS